ncbi:hypothetical protein SAMN05216223_102263 [Actinacidiphila yanglinensis]|uniref:Lipoprotein n=1 Tax=Actinacidiphila yanglinensis TaxID=310779 RepID=A0A1H5VG57_9ACTN|nr:hypothetical protein SAMN05216223_102263 [Actinacidiphila yanglinensis]
MRREPAVKETCAPRRSGIALAAALVALGASLVTGCGAKKSPQPGPHETAVSIQNICDHSLDAKGVAALRLIRGESRLEIALRADQQTVKQVATALSDDLSGDTAQQEHFLCSLSKVGGLVPSGLDIQFQWSQQKPGDHDLESAADVTVFDLAYGALSFDNGTYLGFTCPLPGALAAKSRKWYIDAHASTTGLDAVGRTEKREAAVRLLYSPAVKVAAALGCQGSDLPPTLGTLKPLPMKKK